MIAVGQDQARVLHQSSNLEEPEGTCGWGWATLLP
jgi:hypothetical protein